MTAMNLDVRAVESDSALELYITATPSVDEPPDRQAREIYSAIRALLTETNARILQERVFAAKEAMPVVRQARADSLGGLDDGVAPALLAVAQGRRGALSGIQVHAVRSDPTPRPLVQDGLGCGRLLRLPARTYITLSGITAPETGSAPMQSRAMFEKAVSALRLAGADLSAVARTWVWLGDILSWYDEFNRVRNGFYTEHGLLDGRTGKARLPASTGIGVRPADGAACGLDLVAVVGAHESVEFHPAIGEQQSPFAYGSAFSRAARALTPAGQTVYVSGTASIDRRGRTVHAGDPGGQIETTIDHVRAVLADMNCTDEDVVQAIAYCTTPEVEKAYQRPGEQLPWPQFTVIGDICRKELVFEVEVTASPGARQM